MVILGVMNERFLFKVQERGLSKVHDVGHRKEVVYEASSTESESVSKRVTQLKLRSGEIDRHENINEILFGNMLVVDRRHEVPVESWSWGEEELVGHSTVGDLFLGPIENAPKKAFWALHVIPAPSLFGPTRVMDKADDIVGFEWSIPLGSISGLNSSVPCLVVKNVTHIES
ncbi:hypothetical protein V6N13_059252 [Hibiscus sabdariffa]|uniref:Uncharacterized protein n=1 Tax=Hibiscus sabdariffa TaxID=183260 RepID=A0ABR2GEF0_9ROSI